MKTVLLNGLNGLLVCVACQGICKADQPGAMSTVDQAIKAAGGRDALLSRFTIQEKLNVSDDASKPGNPRESVFDGHQDWWFRSGKGAWKKKENEPAVDLVWAWTLQAFIDPASKIESIPETVDEDRSLTGLRISGAIDPPMDAYFDKSNYRLVRIDWRKDIHRFSDWRDADGSAYPAKCVGYRKATGKPWYVSEIIKLERLAELPSELTKQN